MKSKAVPKSVYLNYNSFFHFTLSNGSLYLDWIGLYLFFFFAVVVNPFTEGGLLLRAGLKNLALPSLFSSASEKNSG